MRELRLRYYQGMAIARGVQFDSSWTPQDRGHASGALRALIDKGKLEPKDWIRLAGADMARRLELEWYTATTGGMVAPTRGLCSQIYQAISAGKRRICAVAPTGAGKTETMIRIALDAVGKGWKVFIIVNRQILVQNMHARFASYGHEIGMVWAEAQPRPDLAVQVCSEQTLKAHKKRDLDHVIQQAGANRVLWLWDEAHEVGFSGTGREILSDPGQSIHVLFTATPWRSSPREGMGDIADAVCLAPLYSQLQAIIDHDKSAEYRAHGFNVNVGSIVPATYKVVRTGHIDTSGIGVSVAGDYAVKPLSARASDPKVLEAQFNVWQEQAGSGRRTLGFCVDTEHTLSAARFWAGRISAPVAVLLGEDAQTGIMVGGAIQRKTRAEVTHMLSTAEAPILFSCDAITTGFDCPPVDVLNVMRPTQSHQLHCQIIGRGLRPCAQTGKQRLLVLDFAGNTDVHLPLHWLTPVDFELKKGIPGAKAVKKVKRAQICPRCFTPCLLSATVCACGFVFGAPPKAVEGRVVTKIEQIGDMPDSDVEKWHRSFQAYHRRCWRMNVEKARHVWRGKVSGKVPDSWFRHAILEGRHSHAELNHLIRGLIVLAKGHNRTLALREGGTLNFVAKYYRLETGLDINIAQLTRDVQKELIDG